MAWYYEPGDNRGGPDEPRIDTELWPYSSPRHAPRTPAFARAMESGDAAVAQKTMPAVVNISTWRVEAARNKPGEFAAAG